jgi:hypothetical protein
MGRDFSSLSVLVQSCDKYSDLWNPFYTLFDKYWPDIPFKIFHLSETKKITKDNIESITTRPNAMWSEMLINALRKITSPYVLLLLEDYLLLKKVDNEKIFRLLDIAEKESAAYIRIFPVPGPDLDHPHYSDIGVIKKNSPYSISTQATIWDRQKLLDFLEPLESAWDLEIKGSQRANLMAGDFLSLKINHHKKTEEGDYPYTYLCTAVYKGKWMKEAIQLCKKEHIEVDLKYRQVETTMERFYRLHYHKMPRPVKHSLDLITSRLK